MAAPLPPDPPRLLIVDDHVGLRELFLFHMKAEGFKVAEAEDGLQGLAKIKSFKPDLIVLDMMMPNLNGLEMLRRMKGEGLPPIPVIVITAYGESFNKETLLAQPGVRDYMSKPVNYDDLAVRIRKILGLPEKSKKGAS